MNFLKVFLYFCRTYTSDTVLNKQCNRNRNEYFSPITYLAKTSPLRTQPMILPRWGTLLTYGRALVTKIFLSPGTGSLGGNHTLTFNFFVMKPTLVPEYHMMMGEFHEFYISTLF